MMSSSESMPVIIPASEVDFQDLLHRATSGKEHFIVEDEGKPIVAILSMKEYDDLVKDHEAYEQDKQRRLRQFEDATRAIGEAIAKIGLTEEQAMEALEQTKKDIFQKYYGSGPKQ